MERYAESIHPKGKIPSGQTTLGTGVSRNYSFPDEDVRKEKFLLVGLVVKDCV